MTLRFPVVLVMFSLCGASAYAQQTPIPEFSARVAEYAVLRAQVELETGVVVIPQDSKAMYMARYELARRIREVRAAANRGDIFTPTAARELIARLRAQLDGATWAALMDDNPGEFRLTIDAEYPGSLPLSSVPSNLLAVLPQLPDGLEYRFIGRHLILRDSRANLILDYVPYALAPCDCDPEHSVQDE